MRARARAMGHAIHPMLIVFPLGLLASAVIFDVIYLVNDSDNAQVAAAYTMGLGVLGGVVAGVFGLVDWLSVPAGTRAERIGALHGVGNVVVLALFAVSWLLRASAEDWEAPALAVVLDFVGIALAGTSAWWGGEMVERLGIGVEDDARPDAPSSLGGGSWNRRGMHGHSSPAAR